MSEEETNQTTEAQETSDQQGGVDAALEEFSGEQSATGQLPATDADKGSFSAIYEVPVQVSAVLGRTSMPVSQLLKLSRGAVIELDRKVGESIDIYVNNRLVARGEVVVVDDHLGITMTEIIKTDQAA